MIVFGISLPTGLLDWAGAESKGVRISLPRMLEAAANCLLAAILFLGTAALAHPLVSRVRAGIGHGLIPVTFVWQPLGAAQWLVGLTPFARVVLVAAQPFRATAAVAARTPMLASGLAAAPVAAGVIGRQDLRRP